jgi:hypothetical protein
LDSGDLAADLGSIAVALVQPLHASFVVNHIGTADRRAKARLSQIKDVRRLSAHMRVAMLNDDKMRDAGFCRNKEREYYAKARAAADPKLKSAYEAAAREYARRARQHDKHSAVPYKSVARAP